MGHEYVEIKNSHAAIESYRRAIGAFGCGFLVASGALLIVLKTSIGRTTERGMASDRRTSFSTCTNIRYTTISEPPLSGKIIPHVRTINT